MLVLSQVTRDMGGPLYLLEQIGGFLPYWILPVVFFLLAALLSFCMGSSWGTYAVALPFVMPLSWLVARSDVLVSPEIYMLVCFAALVDGGVFGDHCSPISDTTVLSSIASSCDHLAHVRTQAPYALTTMAVAGLCGYLGSTMLWSPVMGLVVGLALIILILLVAGKKTDED